MWNVFLQLRARGQPVLFDSLLSKVRKATGVEPTQSDFMAMDGADYGEGRKFSLMAWLASQNQGMLETLLDTGYGTLADRFLSVRVLLREELTNVGVLCKLLATTPWPAWSKIMALLLEHTERRMRRMEERHPDEELWALWSRLLGILPKPVVLGPVSLCGKTHSSLFAALLDWRLRFNTDRWVFYPQRLTSMPPLSPALSGVLMHLRLLHPQIGEAEERLLQTRPLVPVDVLDQLCATPMKPLATQINKELEEYVAFSDCLLRLREPHEHIPISPLPYVGHQQEYDPDDWETDNGSSSESSP
jgi:hypothetical protein